MMSFFYFFHIQNEKVVSVTHEENPFMPQEATLKECTVSACGYPSLTEFDLHKHSFEFFLNQFFHFPGQNIFDSSKYAVFVNLTLRYILSLHNKYSITWY